MDNIDVEVLRTAIAWAGAGHRVTLGTVIRTWGSAPRPPGSWMIIRDDGQVAGSVSGGCIEDDLVFQVTQGQWRLDKPCRVVYGDRADEARRFGLPCGGSVELVLEPLGEWSLLRELLATIENHRVVQRRLDMLTGKVTLLPASRSTDQVILDASALTTRHGPQWRLLIIGGGHLSRYLAAMARMLAFQVVVCEPRQEYHEGCAELEGVELVTTMPDDQVLAMHLDEHSAVVAATHDPKLDDLALMEALRTPAFYVGAIGSTRNNQARRERLLEFDVSPQQAARLKGPVGLNLGGLTPPEIALSILAEITAVRRGIALEGTLANWEGSKTVCRT